RLSANVRKNVIRLAKDCQRELNCEGDLIYGNFDDVQGWECEKVLAELDPVEECVECVDGYNYVLFQGNEVSLVCDRCDESEDWYEDGIDSFKEFFAVDSGYSGSSFLEIINNPSIPPELAERFIARMPNPPADVMFDETCENIIVPEEVGSAIHYLGCSCDFCNPVWGDNGTGC
ncbi:unnamed protein product, partial [marine sediment metagenome]